MPQIALTFIACILWCFTSGQTFYTVETLPNPKHNNNGYVSNPDTILTAKWVDSLNTVLRTIEDSTTVQIAIAVVHSIGDADSYAFRIALANYWGVGQADKDNGLLFLIVLDKKRIELAVGYGLETVFPDSLCLKIIMENMVPLAKDKKYGESLMAGVQQIQLYLKNE
jgi:uncharacterized protein